MAHIDYYLATISPNCYLAGRRPGDIAECWADTGKAERDLGWRAERTVADMAADAWRWQEGNPTGFPG